MNHEDGVLYAWDQEKKQVLRLLKLNFQSVYDFDSADTKRMFVYDGDYKDSKHLSYRYGSYLFSLDNLLIGFWEPHDVTHFPAEFRAHLLLLGLE